jgi:nucleoside-diphosphate-sugar epimerase
MGREGLVVIVGMGFVGGRLAGRLVGRGVEVVGVSGSEEGASEARGRWGVDVRSVDVGDGEAVRRLAGGLGREVGAVVHCASSGRGGEEAYRRVFVGGCRNLVEGFPGARVAFTSSTSVYPQVCGEVVDEDSEVVVGRETGRLLLEAEGIVRGAGGIVARLAGLYGPGRSYPLLRLLRGEAKVEVAEGVPDGRILNQLHGDDAAGALEWLLGLGKGGGLFNVVDDRPMTQREIYAGLCGRLGLLMPGDGEPELGRKRGWTHKRVSNARLRAAGWAPAYPSYFDAVERDEELVRSVRLQVG